MPKYVLSPAAQISLKEIKTYSIRQFGKNRTLQYIQEISHQFNELAKDPTLGKSREEIKAGYKSHFVGSHTIYYRIKTNHIEVIDVLHQSMEPKIHL